MLLEALAIAGEIGSKPAGQSALEVAAGLASLREGLGARGEVFGAAEAQMAQTGLQRDPADEAFLAPLIAQARRRWAPRIRRRRDRGPSTGLRGGDGRSPGLARGWADRRGCARHRMQPRFALVAVTCPAAFASDAPAPRSVVEDRWVKHAGVPRTLLKMLMCSGIRRNPYSCRTSEIAFRRLRTLAGKLVVRSALFSTTPVRGSNLNFASTAASSSSQRMRCLAVHLNSSI